MKFIKLGNGNIIPLNIDIGDKLSDMEFEFVTARLSEYLRGLTVHSK
jgi:hypothetical protein